MSKLAGGAGVALAASGSGSIATPLFLVFLVLKLTGYISWSWWWVTLPLWGGAAIFLSIAVIALIAYGAVTLSQMVFKW